MDTRAPTGAEADRDSADLAKFGYKQELKRTLGVFSSFAVAFSYISPSTGIFTLFSGSFDEVIESRKRPITCRGVEDSCLRRRVMRLPPS